MLAIAATPITMPLLPMGALQCPAMIVRHGAIGPNLTYNFQVGAVPVLTSVRWLHEFNAKNRLAGDAGFITVTIPLGGAPAH
jgi:hypothetical protein